MTQAYSDLLYREYTDIESGPATTQQHALFWLDLETNEAGELAMQGEDVNFCAKWAALGGKVWADTTIRFRHHGMNDWPGCYAEYLAEQRGQQIAAE